MYRALYNGYGQIINLGSSLQDYLLLGFRLLWGFGFFMAGWGKLQNISPIIDFFESINIPYPDFHANLVAWIECIGGLLLMVGFATRLTCIPLIFIMFIALTVAHKKVTLNLINDPESFIKQTAFSYFLISLLLFSFGPGRISLDALFERFFPTPGIRKSR